MIRNYLICLILILSSLIGQAQVVDSMQVDVVDLVVGRKKIEETNDVRNKRKVHFSILPAPVSAPGGGRVIITSINGAFTIGDPDKTNLSNVYLLPFTDFSSRYGLFLRHNIWLPNNSWNLIGDYRLSHYPQYVWGLGGNSQEFERSLVDTDYSRIYQTVLRGISKKWFVGPGYALDYSYNIEETEIGFISNLENYPVETTDPSVASGLTANIVYDGRYNALNPPKGAYFIASYRINAKAFGSDTDYQSLFIDARKYFPIQRSKGNILAVRSYYWTILSGEVPYLYLPSTNWAPATGIASRGFQAGRYRSNAMIYGEAEQRVQLTNNGLFGMVIFANIASASEFETQNFKSWKTGVGFGLRAKLNKYANTNLALDFGFSEDFWSVWVNIGEMF
jgi:hypothetical protein